jgi:DNA-binding NtrC family response regulator
MKRILVVDDEKIIRENLARILTEEHYHVHSVADGTSALGHLESHDNDLVLLDLNLPDINGLDVLEKIRNTDPDLLVIVITGYASVESAVKAIKLGAYDYIKKPFKADVIKLIVKLALETRILKTQVGLLKKSLSRPESIGIVASSPAMQQVLAQVAEVARHESATVLLTGESGTGKNVIANRIHQASPRATMPLLHINCAALPENLLESELFGHEKGAFTDAVQRKKGLFEEANGGTIFLDEIGEMPMTLQAKLLGVLERRKIRRIGGNRDILTDIRLIAATNVDPKAAIKEKKLREDLYYRLNVFPIHLPPLRQRPEDIQALASHFLLNYAEKFHKAFKTISESAQATLTSYHWPGNVRELKNVFERICIMHDAVVLERHHLPQELESSDSLSPAMAIPEHLYDLELAIEHVTTMLIKKALRKAEGNTAKAARLLGIPRGTLRYKIDKFCS